GSPGDGNVHARGEGDRPELVAERRERRLHHQPRHLIAAGAPVACSEARALERLGVARELALFGVTDGGAERKSWRRGALGGEPRQLFEKTRTARAPAHVAWGSRCARPPAVSSGHDAERVQRSPMPRIAAVFPRNGCVTCVRHPRDRGVRDAAHVFHWWYGTCPIDTLT